ncbi:hypothetical protein SNE40_012738 [Patella caerulea]|uniref:F-box domain-containing protein n=1 Tax=Patella caerulea TaxID=87958 RepID=A0AAN8JGL3_PATCE
MPSFIITNLPDDILYHILSFLDVKSLCRICQVCRFFKYLSVKDCVWLQYLNSRPVQIENALSYSEFKYGGYIHRRTSSSIDRKTQYKASLNWSNGVFRETSQVSHGTRLMPWIQKVESNIWMSTKNVIRCFCIQKNGNLRERKNRQLYGLNDDVSRFIIKDDVTVAACRDGSVCGWKNESCDMMFKYDELHDSEVHCVDFYDQTMVSGSRDKTVKVVSMKPEREVTDLLKKTIYMGDRVWSLKLSPCGSLLATGTAGNKGLPALTTWDLKTGEMLSTLDPDHQAGAGILDIKFESPHTLLTCGYDTNLSMWDLRTDTCVARWTEPFDSTVYCFQTDGNYSIVTGTARYGMTRLWDKRKTISIQQYYSGRNRSSPVYSLVFDPGRLYVALDIGIHKLDFT